MNKTIMKLAEIHAVSPESIEQEIICAMREAMQSRESEARSFWQRMAPDRQEPTLEMLLDTLSHMAVENMHCSLKD